MSGLHSTETKQQWVTQRENTPGDFGIESDTKEQELNFEKWLSDIYSIGLLEDHDLREFYEAIEYQTFNRDQVLQTFFERVNSPQNAVKLIILCAVRGPVKAHQLARKVGLDRYNIPLKATKGTAEISFNRITTCTADLAAFYLKKMDFKKRINCECPGWLQFPSAGSIRMPSNLRQQHKEFSILFSERLPDSRTKTGFSEFNEGIYEQMELNSYYNEELHLFD